MSKHKIKKFTSIMLILTLTGTMIPCSAANLVPFNGTKSIVTPSVPITNPEASNSTDCEKCTFDEAIDLKDKEGYLCINPNTRIFMHKGIAALCISGIIIMDIFALILGGSCCFRPCCRSSRSSRSGYVTYVN